ncbi:hypothetical protein Droror1_Dr00017989 [Drosera rotundifolia]
MRSNNQQVLMLLWEDKIPPTIETWVTVKGSDGEEFAEQVDGESKGQVGSVMGRSEGAAFFDPTHRRLDTTPIGHNTTEPKTTPNTNQPPPPNRRTTTTPGHLWPRNHHRPRSLTAQHRPFSGSHGEDEIEKGIETAREEKVAKEVDSDDGERDGNGEIEGWWRRVVELSEEKEKS